MKDSIKLSEKHGVNPSINHCFYCGEELGIVTFGKLPSTKEDKDPKAPRDCVISLEPCDKCKEKYKDYLLVVEAPENKEPTGRWIGAHRESVVEEYKNWPIACVTPDVFEKLIKQAELQEPNKDKEETV